MPHAEELGVFGIVAAPVFLAFRFTRQSVAEFVQLLLELGDSRVVVGCKYPGPEVICAVQAGLGGLAPRCPEAPLGSLGK